MRSEQRAISAEGRQRVDIRAAGDPLAFLSEEHLRQRQVCALIEGLATAERPDRAIAAEALDYIRTEMPLHHLDEDEDLFPLLRRRALPEDELAPTLSRLSVEHRTCSALGAAADRVLARLAAGGAADTEDRAALAAFLDAKRRHLILENAIVLPLARVRLTRHDRQTLALRMAARRGICLLEDRPDAE